MNIIQWLRAKFTPDAAPEREDYTKDRAFRKKVKARRAKNKQRRNTRRK